MRLVIYDRLLRALPRAQEAKEGEIMTYRELWQLITLLNKFRYTFGFYIGHGKEDRFIRHSSSLISDVRSVIALGGSYKMQRFEVKS